ncbi:RagB/SusD family nutrient uptake outer membrane protein [Muricauda oceani]|uniref:RagB/SusD family nutrient uptake outer membrane protein n=1 Tax=Flagellimonas oceani TaxID=2698672 RepID=A0A6G7J519_9FLAO|nr:RagB/SusD family nutrient uptake outer membrane protein [Allomuricauda oceani]MBW8242199.1 RagB/SusD family nutrient uptake outer membrane protein [Allomuricauda oceani]QII45963.1 RagB/SusD family nutrient uptake outer membrane protein [Allomuricauda oceani]
MKRITKYLNITLLVSLVFSCTDLEIEGTDSLITEGFAGVANVQGEVANIRNIVAGGQLGNQEGLFALNEVSTDEYIVPTRGTDWGDNGRWLSIHRQTWNAELSDIVVPWQQLNSVTINATRVISPKSVNTASGDITEQKAAARFYRAWAMHWILDMWRQVPYRDVDLPNSAIPEVLTGQVAIDSIVADLNIAIQDLPDVTAGDAIGLKSNPTKASALHLLAKVHLNKHVYLETTPQAADMQVVIDAVDEIAASGYTLAGEGEFFDIFKPGNDTETIWWSPADAGSRIWHTLHYNQNFPGFNDGGGWNGFTTLAEFYDLFEGPSDTNYPNDGQEERRGVVHDPSTANAENLGIGLGFLINQQYEQDGTPLNARDNVGGVPLVFTREAEKAEYTSPGDDAVLETAGIRMLKYHPNEEGGDRRQHVVKYRFADAYLMKAEAMLRMGNNPLAMINALRETRGATPLASVTEADLLAERGRELYQESVRRQDLIRFGQYLRAWNLKEAGDETKLIFPIPRADVLANPNLVQNPGYQ